MGYTGFHDEQFDHCGASSPISQTPAGCLERDLGWLHSGPDQGPDAASPGKLKIVCTVGMVTDIVRQVAGEHAEVTGLLNEGSTHTFTCRPTRHGSGDVGDVVFYCGLHLEGRLVDDYEAAHKKGRKIFAVTAGIPHDKLRGSEAAGLHDPHVWGDVQLWMECVREVARQPGQPRSAARRRLSGQRRQAVGGADGTRSLYPRRDPLDSEQQRVLVTAHDAFAYFGTGVYGMQVRSVQGISTDSQAGVNDTNALVAFLVENKIPTVFVEASVNERDLRAVIEGAQQQNWRVRIGGTLYSDSMGPPGTYEGTYIGMQDHNATQIARSLGGTAPERGWQGKLTAPSH